MRVLLINPPYPGHSVGFEKLMVIEPLALEYVGTILQKEGHEVRIFDAVLDNSLDKTLREFRPQAVSCTCFYVHLYVIQSLFAKIKAFDPTITTVVAGSYATTNPENFYMKNVDIVNSGEDFFVASKLFHGIEIGNLSGVEGIHYRDSTGVWKVGPPATRCISIDELPFPDRTLTKKYRKNYYWYFEQEIAAVWGSVGCPFKCYYCTQWTKNGGRFVARTPKSLVDEIEQITQKAVFIIDDNTFANRTRVKEVVRLIRERGIRKKYMCYCSPNMVIKNQDVIREWKELGLCELMVGFESIRSGDLSDVALKTSIATNDEAIRILHEIGVDTMAGFIVYPDFTKEDFKTLRQYTRSRKMYYMEFTPLTPFPGTVFYEQVRDKVKDLNPELFDMQHMLLDSTLPLKDFYREMAYTYLTTYMPWRALRAGLSFPLSPNPLNPMYRSFVRFVLKVKRSYRDHEVVMPPLILEKQAQFGQTTERKDKNDKRNNQKRSHRKSSQVAVL